MLLQKLILGKQSVYFKLLDGNIPKIPRQQTCLEKSPSKDETKSATWWCQPSKAPG